MVSIIYMIPLVIQPLLFAFNNICIGSAPMEEHAMFCVQDFVKIELSIPL